MKELLIRGNTWCYYHRTKAILLFIPCAFIAWFGGGAIARALSPTGDIVFVSIVLVLYIAFMVYVWKQGGKLNARKTKTETKV